MGVTPDLAARLRAGVVDYAGHPDMGGSCDYEATEALMREAADEIERLSKRNWPGVMYFVNDEDG